MGKSEEESEHGTKTDREKKVGKEEAGRESGERRKCFHSAIPASFLCRRFVRTAHESGRDGVMNQKELLSIEDRECCAPTVALFPIFPSLYTYCYAAIVRFPALATLCIFRGASVSSRTREGGEEGKESSDGRKNFSGQKKREEEVEGAKVGTL